MTISALKSLRGLTCPWIIFPSLRMDAGPSRRSSNSRLLCRYSSSAKRARDAGRPRSPSFAFFLCLSPSKSVCPVSKAN